MLHHVTQPGWGTRDRWLHQTQAALSPGAETDQDLCGVQVTRRQRGDNLNILLIRYAQSLVMGAYSYSQDPGGSCQQI